jgi:hypothetical protein
LVRMPYQGGDSYVCPLMTLLFWKFTGGLVTEPAFLASNSSDIMTITNTFNTSPTAMLASRGTLVSIPEEQIQSHQDQ